MTDDALERLKSRQRPKVPGRDLEAIEPQPSPSPDTKTPSNQDIKTSVKQESNQAKTLETKASTMRLEATIARELSLYCKQVGISREVLIEAMFLHFQRDQDAQPGVLEEAKARAARRAELGNRRRAQTMMERFGSEGGVTETFT